MTESEVDAHYDSHRRELDRLTVLNLVASAESLVHLKVNNGARLGIPLLWNGTFSRKMTAGDDPEELNMSTVLRGIVHGKIIELEKESGLPEGQPITIQIEALGPVSNWLDRISKDHIRSESMVSKSLTCATSRVTLPDEQRCHRSAGDAELPRCPSFVWQAMPAGDRLSMPRHGGGPTIYAANRSRCRVAGSPTTSAGCPPFSSVAERRQAQPAVRDSPRMCGFRCADVGCASGALRPSRRTEMTTLFRPFIVRHA
jgi:hypothetical protein